MKRSSQRNTRQSLTEWSIGSHQQSCTAEYWIEPLVGTVSFVKESNKNYFINEIVVNLGVFFFGFSTYPLSSFVRSLFNLKIQQKDKYLDRKNKTFSLNPLVCLTVSRILNLTRFIGRCVLHIIGQSSSFFSPR